MRLPIIALNQMLVICPQNDGNGEMIGHGRQQGFNVFFIPLKMKILLEIKMNIPGSGCVGSTTGVVTLSTLARWPSIAMW